MKMNFLKNNKNQSGIPGILFMILLSFCYLPNSSKAQFNGNFTIERHFLDKENFLDWKAYQTPLNWRKDWNFTENGIRYSVGSISMYRFYVSKEIRLSKKIGTYFKVFYEQREESFFTQESGFQEAEFRFGTNPYYVSITGFPEHSKKMGHMGLALSYGERYKPVYVRLNQLEMFTVFNEKNANTDKNKDDRFYNKLPVIQEVDFQYFNKDRFFLLVNHWHIGDAELKMKKPQKSYNYRGSSSEINAEWKSSEESIYGNTLKTVNEFRRNPLEDLESKTVHMEQNLSLRSYDVYLSFPWSEKNHLTLGLLSSLFENRIDSVNKAKRYFCRLSTDQIYGFWNRVLSEWFSWRYSLQLGQADLSKDFMDLKVKPEQKTNEVKAGFGFILEEIKQYRFFVNTTWDLDLFKIRQWDGGNVQLQFHF